jgi:hypothetical protein
LLISIPFDIGDIGSFARKTRLETFEKLTIQPFFFIKEKPFFDANVFLQTLMHYLRG